MRLAHLTVAAVACAAALTAASQPAVTSGLDLASLDRTIRPQDDLYRFANGGWLTRTDIPSDRVAYGAFIELADKAESDIRAIIEEAAAASGRASGIDGAADRRSLREHDERGSHRGARDDTHPP